MKAQKILLPIIILIAGLAFFSIFIVKEVNQAIVLQFGDPKKIIVKPRILKSLAGGKTQWVISNSAMIFGISLAIM